MDIDSPKVESGLAKHGVDLTEQVSLREGPARARSDDPFQRIHPRLTSRSLLDGVNSSNKVKSLGPTGRAGRISREGLGRAMFVKGTSKQWRYGGPVRDRRRLKVSATTTINKNKRVTLHMLRTCGVNCGNK